MEEENQPPYFVEYDRNKLYEIYRGDEEIIWLPEFVDDDGDKVEMSYVLSEKQ